MRILLTAPFLALLTACGGTHPIKSAPLEPVAKSVVTPTKEEFFYSKKKEYIDRSSEMRVGRYSTARLSSTPDQEDLLQVIIETKIPNNIQTVGGAIQFLLQRSGYQLADPSKQGVNVNQLFKMKLPFSHRKIGPITLKNALLLIAGEAYWMKVDPVHRLIAFDTIKEFK